MKLSTKILVSTAVSSLLISANALLAQDEHKTADGKVKCEGGNACKAKGECGGKGHGCAGENTCKGQGWISVSTKEECTKVQNENKPSKADKKAKGSKTNK